MKQALSKPRSAANAHAPVAVLTALALIGGCGYQDWEAPLTGGYRVGTAGSSQVLLWKDDTLSNISLADEDIAAYGFNARFIELRLETSKGSVRKPAQRFVLIDVENGKHQRFATEQELLQALPPGTAAMPWALSQNPNPPRFVSLFAAVGVVVVTGIVVSAVVWAATRKRQRSQQL